MGTNGLELNREYTGKNCYDIEVKCPAISIRHWHWAFFHFDYLEKKSFFSLKDHVVIMCPYHVSLSCVIIMCHARHAVRGLLPAIPADPFLPSGPEITEKDKGLVLGLGWGWGLRLWWGLGFCVYSLSWIKPPTMCSNMVPLRLLYKAYKPRMVVQTLKDFAILLIPQVNCCCQCPDVSQLWFFQLHNNNTML